MDTHLHTIPFLKENIDIVDSYLKRNHKTLSLLHQFILEIMPLPFTLKAMLITQDDLSDPIRWLLRFTIGQTMTLNKQQPFFYVTKQNVQKKTYYMVQVGYLDMDLFIQTFSQLTSPISIKPNQSLNNENKASFLGNFIENIAKKLPLDNQQLAQQFFNKYTDDYIRIDQTFNISIKANDGNIDQVDVRFLQGFYYPLEPQTLFNPINANVQRLQDIKNEFKNIKELSGDLIEDVLSAYYTYSQMASLNYKSGNKQTLVFTKLPQLYFHQEKSIIEVLNFNQTHTKEDLFYKYDHRFVTLRNQILNNLSNQIDNSSLYNQLKNYKQMSNLSLDKIIDFDNNYYLVLNPYKKSDNKLINQQQNQETELIQLSTIYIQKQEEYKKYQITAKQSTTIDQVIKNDLSIDDSIFNPSIETVMKDFLIHEVRLFILPSIGVNEFTFDNIKDMISIISNGFLKLQLVMSHQHNNDVELVILDHIINTYDQLIMLMMSIQMSKCHDNPNFNGQYIFCNSQDTQNDWNQVIQHKLKNYNLEQKQKSAFVFRISNQQFNQKIEYQQNTNDRALNLVSLFIRNKQFKELDPDFTKILVSNLMSTFLNQSREQFNQLVKNNRHYIFTKQNNIISVKDNQNDNLIKIDKFTKYKSKILEKSIGFINSFFTFSQTNQSSMFAIKCVIKNFSKQYTHQNKISELVDRHIIIQLNGKLKKFMQQVINTSQIKYIRERSNFFSQELFTSQVVQYIKSHNTLYKQPSRYTEKNLGLMQSAFIFEFIKSPDSNSLSQSISQLDLDLQIQLLKFVIFENKITSNDTLKFSNFIFALFHYKKFMKEQKNRKQMGGNAENLQYISGIFKEQQQISVYQTMLMNKSIERPIIDLINSLAVQSEQSQPDRQQNSRFVKQEEDKFIDLIKIDISLSKRPFAILPQDIPFIGQLINNVITVTEIDNNMLTDKDIINWIRQYDNDGHFVLNTLPIIKNNKFMDKNLEVSNDKEIDWGNLKKKIMITNSTNEYEKPKQTQYTLNNDQMDEEI